MQDNDEAIPNGSIPPTVFPNHPTFPTNSGWAGRVFSHLKNAAVLHCPDDLTEGDAAHNAVPVSYGMNWNMATRASVRVMGGPRENRAVLRNGKQHRPHSKPR